MDTPAFTAEALIYRTRRHYQTSRYRPPVNSHGISSIWPGMKAEEIDIHGCMPGYTLWESGEEWGAALSSRPPKVKVVATPAVEGRLTAVRAVTTYRAMKIRSAPKTVITPITILKAARHVARNATLPIR